MKNSSAFSFYMNDQVISKVHIADQDMLRPSPKKYFQGFIFVSPFVLKVKLAALKSEVSIN